MKVYPIDYVAYNIPPHEETLRNEKFNKDYFIYKVLREYYDVGVL